MTTKKAEMLFSNLQDEDEKNGFTLVATFSRAWCIKNWFATLMKMNIDMANCHVLIFDNSDNALVLQALQGWTNKLHDVFRSWRLYKTWRRGTNITLMNDDQGYKKSKLPFIYAMQHDIMKLVKTETFVQIEDDTLSPPDAVPKLLEILEKNKNCGIATAIETGRSMSKLHPTRTGVHYIVRKENRIMQRISLSPWDKGIKSVDACGWYCFASLASIWREAFKMMPKDMTRIPRFALDNIFTNNIKMMGFDILADFSLWCDHMNAVGFKILFWNKDDAIKMGDYWIEEWQEYGQGIYLPDPLAPKKDRVMRYVEKIGIEKIIAEE